MSEESTAVKDAPKPTAPATAPAATGATQATTAPASAPPIASQTLSPPAAIIPTAKLVLDQDADIHTVTDENRPKLVPVPRRGRVEWIYPKGTEFSGDHAIQLVRTGQASPSNDACAVACGMTPAQIANQNVEYRMTSMGINDPKHREFFKAGVIVGYTPEGEIIPGPNYEAHKAAEEAAQQIGNV